MSQRTTERVKAYVDGFNLYHGLRDKYGRRYHWLDLEELTLKILRPQQMLVEVAYFTARVRQQPESEKRQATYIDALTAHSRHLTIIEGRFQEKTRFCRACRVEMILHEEKETDVSIAAAMIEDAVNDVFDAAMLISADSDLCPAVRAVKRLRPDKRVFAAFPPKRRSDDLRTALGGQVMTIGTANIRQSQLPETVLAGGVVRPDLRTGSSSVRCCRGLRPGRSKPRSSTAVPPAWSHCGRVSHGALASCSAAAASQDGAVHVRRSRRAGRGARPCLVDRVSAGGSGHGRPIHAVQAQRAAAGGQPLSG